MTRWAYRRWRWGMFMRHTRSFFTNTYPLVCGAKHPRGYHTCKQPLGHFGAHWCQCRASDGEAWR